MGAIDCIDDAQNLEAVFRRSPGDLLFLTEETGFEMSQLVPVTKGVVFIDGWTSPSVGEIRLFDGISVSLATVDGQWTPKGQIRLYHTPAPVDLDGVIHSSPGDVVPFHNNLNAGFIAQDSDAPILPLEHIMKQIVPSAP